MSVPSIGVENQLADRVRVVGFELRDVEIRERSSELEAAVSESMLELKGRYSDPPSASNWAARRNPK